MDILKLSGYDDCCVGLVERFGSEPHLVYDYRKVLAKLEREDGMTEDEAREFFDFNIGGAWVGEHTPGFIVLKPADKDIDDFIDELVGMEDSDAEEEPGCTP